MNARRRHRVGAAAPLADSLLADEPNGLAIDFTDGSYAIRNGSALQVGRASDLLTVSRASSGMRYNAAGVMESVGADLMRFDHDPVTRERLGVLIEGQRTNLFTQSEFANGVTDAPVSSGLVSATTFTGLTGSTGLAFGHDGSTNSSAYKTGVTVNGTTYTLSFFVRMDDGAAPAFGSTTNGSSLNDFYCFVGGAPPSPLTYMTAHLGGGLYRVWATGIASSGGACGIAKVATNSSRTFKVSGYQIEAAPMPSSYIPTTASQVTRAADFPTLARSAIPYDDTQVSIMVEANWNYGSGLASALRASLQIDEGVDVNRLFLYNGATQRNRMVTNVPGQGSVALAGAAMSAAPVRTAVRVGPSNMRIAHDGVLSTSSTDYPLVPASLTTVRFGRTASGAELFGHIKRVVIVPRLWSDAELIARSTP